MDLDKLRQIVKDQKLYKKENTKNIVCICPLCGDHPNDYKKGHLYISKDSSIPVAHCFFCNGSKSIRSLIYLLTSDRKIADAVLCQEEMDAAQKKAAIVKKKTNVQRFEVPTIDTGSFLAKRVYMKKRANFLWKPEHMPNLIFDFEKFFADNHLTDVAISQLGPLGLDLMQRKFIAFLSRCHSMLYCRCIDDNEYYKFRKIQIQNSDFDFLDYVSFPGGNPNGNLLVLSEGTFDIMGEYVTDSLGLKKKARLFAAGQSYSYDSLLKSVCTNEAVFKPDVVILSDTDKHVRWYSKFLRNRKHVMNSCRIYYNKNQKDFGKYPIIPYELKVERL